MAPQTKGDIFSLIFTPTLPFPLGYVSAPEPVPGWPRTDAQIPTAFRALAIALAAPFLFFMALDLVGYGECFVPRPALHVHVRLHGPVVVDPRCFARPGDSFGHHGT